MPTGPAARLTDAVAHGVPPVLGPGPGSSDVLIGFMPAWRGLPLAAAAAFMANAAATAARNTAAMARTAAGDPSGAVDLAASISQFAQSLSSSGADVHNCGLPTPAPHVGGVVVTGSPTVLINNLPACRMGDSIAEAGPPNIISMGCLNVIIGDMGGGGLAVLQGIAAGVNPAGSVINCGFIIDAVIARANQTDPGATAPAGQDGSWNQIEARHGMNFTWGSSFDAAFTAVENGGHGATAIIGIGYSGGGSHVVAIRNEGGVVGIVEGQNWGAGNPAEVITTRARANTRYNSDGGSNIGWGMVP